MPAQSILRHKVAVDQLRARKEKERKEIKRKHNTHNHRVESAKARNDRRGDIAQLHQAELGKAPRQKEDPAGARVGKHSRSTV